MVESSAENPGYYLELASDSPIRIDALYERFTSQFDELQALLDKKYGHTDSEFEDMK
jgi:hypothetical protein